jgi:hypothetical protein
LVSSVAPLTRLYDDLKFVIPAKAGIQAGEHWIPPYQVRGRLSQARNDDPVHLSLRNSLGRSFASGKIKFSTDHRDVGMT